MWIRSQNRMQLQDVNRFVIERFEIGIYIVGDGCALGRYSTKEKALKVLDQIQYNMEPFVQLPLKTYDELKSNIEYLKRELKKVKENE